MFVLTVFCWSATTISTYWVTNSRCDNCLAPLWRHQACYVEKLLMVCLVWKLTDVECKSGECQTEMWTLSPPSSDWESRCFLVSHRTGGVGGHLPPPPPSSPSSTLNIISQILNGAIKRYLWWRIQGPADLRSHRHVNVIHQVKLSLCLVSRWESPPAPTNCTTPTSLTQIPSEWRTWLDFMWISESISMHRLSFIKFNKV